MVLLERSPVRSCTSPSRLTVRCWPAAESACPRLSGIHPPGRKLAEFPGKTGSVGCLVFAPGGESLIFGSEDGRVRSWHLVQEARTHRPARGTPIGGLGAGVHPGRYHADLLRGRPFDQALECSRRNIADHSERAPGSRRGPGRSAPTACSWPARASTRRCGYGTSPTAGSGLSWPATPIGSRRGVLPGRPGPGLGGSDKTVRLWDAMAASRFMFFEGHSDTVRALAFDPRGKLLVSASDDRTIRGMEPGGGPGSCSRWPAPSTTRPWRSRPTVRSWRRATTGEISRSGMSPPGRGGGRSRGPTPAIWGLSFSPDGRTLAAACDDAKVRLWDPITGQVILVLDGHTQRVNAVAFSPDGSTLASASHDGAVRLWHAEHH